MIRCTAQSFHEHLYTSFINSSKKETGLAQCRGRQIEVERKSSFSRTGAKEDDY